MELKQAQLLYEEQEKIFDEFARVVYPDYTEAQIEVIDEINALADATKLIRELRETIHWTKLLLKSIPTIPTWVVEIKPSKISASPQKEGE